MRKIAALIFDLDGTLLDSAADFHFIINKMLNREQRQEITLNAIKQHVSNGAQAMLEFAFKTSDTDTLAELKHTFLELYHRDINKKSTLYPGIETLLCHLDRESIPWAIATNKPFIYTQKIVEHFSALHSAAAIICPEHVKHTKPNPESLFLACEKMSVNADNCWYFGDHIRDIQAGNAAGMHTIGCNYGYLSSPNESLQWPANQLVDSAQQIITLLQD